ncbi:hypothetical protein NUACC26_070200 [Scytonema sp. NUACC26]
MLLVNHFQKQLLRSEVSGNSVLSLVDPTVFNEEGCHLSEVQDREKAVS